MVAQEVTLDELAISYEKAYDMNMTTLTVSDARTALYQLVAHLQDGEAPILITGKKGNAVLVSEDEWRSVVETLHLASIPKMALSIQKGMKEPIDACSSEIDL